jgi:hypothetical protein
MEEDSHMLRTEVCQAIQDSVRVGRLDRAELQQLKLTGSSHCFGQQPRMTMEINLALITHHPTLSIAVLGIQQAWVVLPIGIAIPIPVPLIATIFPAHRVSVSLTLSS